jgi:membrane-bound metal-dependent hydrolase YbcI (DUF457 family)
MLGVTHRRAGALAGVSFAYFTHTAPLECLLFAVAAYVGALLPDADCPGSTIARFAASLALPVVAITYFVTAATIPNPQLRFKVSLLSGAALVVIPFALKLLLGHRGALHSFLFWLPLGFLAWWFLPPGYLLRSCLAGISLGAMIGGILPDMLTPAGVEALWPITDRDLRLIPRPIAPRTGGWFEAILFRPCVTVLLFAAAGLFLFRLF